MALDVSVCAALGCVRVEDRRRLSLLWSTVDVACGIRVLLTYGWNVSVKAHCSLDGELVTEWP
jgi:hypothetical protein